MTRRKHMGHHHMYLISVLLKPIIHGQVKQKNVSETFVTRNLTMEGNATIFMSRQCVLDKSLCYDTCLRSL